ncbi:MAG: S41 family peptidase [Alphaproteobacteria bacterium]|nr:S41 family peptidase [Alphaproteobacteria bacterium]
MPISAPNMRYPGTIRFLMRLLIPVLVLIGSACASPIDSTNRNFGASSSHVLGIAYQYIRDRYIESVPMQDVALGGMRGISAIDPAFNVKRVGDKIRLFKDGKQVAEFAVAPPQSADKWASLTTAVVEASRAYSPQLKAASAEELFKVIFDGALERLDRYSRYATAAQARENRALRSGFGGIGVQIRQEMGVTKIVIVFPETPAERAGLKSKDLILEVDGVAIAGMSLRQVANRLRGANGSQVRLTISRKGVSKPLSIRIVRDHVIANTVIMKEEDNIAYVRITRFNQRTSTDLARAILRARRHMGEKFKGVILDLRDNPGGLLDQAVEVSDLFLTSGRIVSTEGRHPSSFQRYNAGAGDVANGKPLVVLVNGRSASSSEIVAAALQDLKRAVLIGTNTYGKGTVQSVFRLPNDGELVLTWSRFHAPSGYTLQNLGVLPTVCTAGSKFDAAALVDELRSGRHRTVEALQLWRTQNKPTHKRLVWLRKVCPAKSASNDDERALKLAKQLLSDETLYNLSLQLSHASVATR